jgi:ERCC4-type nuclease
MKGRCGLNSKEICIWLSGIKGIGHKKLQSLMEYFKEPYGIFECKECELEKVAGISDRDVQSIIAARSENYIDENGAKIPYCDLDEVKKYRR